LDGLQGENEMETGSTSFFTDTNNCSSHSMSGRQSIEILADFVYEWLSTINQQVIQPINPTDCK
jgi:hypothetical protein